MRLPFESQLLYQLSYRPVFAGKIIRGEGAMSNAARRLTSHHFRAAVMAFSKTRKAIRKDSRLSEGIATRGRASISFYLPDKKIQNQPFFRIQIFALIGMGFAS